MDTASLSLILVFNRLMNTTWNTAQSCWFWDSEGISSVFKYINITSYINLNIKPISYKFRDGIYHLCEKLNITNQFRPYFRRGKLTALAEPELLSRFKSWSDSFNHKPILFKSGLSKRNILSAIHDLNSCVWDQQNT